MKETPLQLLMVMTVPPTTVINAVTLATHIVVTVAIADTVADIVTAINEERHHE